MAVVRALSRVSNVTYVSTQYRHGIANGQGIRLMGVSDRTWLTTPTNAAGFFTVTGVGNESTASIASIAFSTPTVTVTTSAAHGFAAGQLVTIAAATAAGNNGTFLILTAPTTTTFTLSNTSGAAQAGAAGTATISPWLTFLQTLANASVTEDTEQNIKVLPVHPATSALRPSALAGLTGGWIATGSPYTYEGVLKDASLSSYVYKSSTYNSYIAYDFDNPAPAIQSNQYVLAMGVRLGVRTTASTILDLKVGNSLFAFTPPQASEAVSIRGAIAAPASAAIANIDWDSEFDPYTTTSSRALWYDVNDYLWTYTTTSGFNNNVYSTGDFHLQIIDNTSVLSNRATIYEAWADIVFGTLPYLSPLTGETLTSNNTHTVTSRPTVTWTHRHADSLSQVGYRVKVYTSAQTTPETSTTNLVWDSGQVASSSASATVGVDLTNGTTYYVYVKTAVNPWSTTIGTTSSVWKWSTWGSAVSTSTVTFTMAITAPTAPTTASTWVAGSQAYSVTATGSSFGGTQMFAIQRSYDGGTTWATVRNGSGLWADMLTNSGFETASVTGWAGAGTPTPTIAASTVQKRTGSYSGLITWGTGAAFSQSMLQTVTTVIGQQYTFSVYVYVPTGAPDVYATAYFVASGTAVTTKNAWTRATVTFTATSTSTQVGVGNQTSATSGQLCYIDDARLDLGASAQTYLTATVTDYECDRDSSLIRYRAVVTGTSGSAVLYAVGATHSATTNTSDTTWWFKAPLNPSLNCGSVKVQADSFAITRDESIGVFRPYGRSKAIVVSGVLGGKDGSFEVAATSLAEWQAIEPLLMAQQTLLVQDPLGDQKYIRITRRSYQVEGTRTVPVFRADVEYVEVDEP